MRFSTKAVPGAHLSIAADERSPGSALAAPGLMATRCPWRLCLLLLALQPPLKVLSQDLDLADALEGKAATSTPKPTAPEGGAGRKEGAATTTKIPPKVSPKVPAGTKAPVKPKPKPADGDFDLADALDPNNDIDLTERGTKRGGRPSGGDTINQHEDNNETTAEVGTIAGIASAVAMALVGAISSYISYQKKKLCFSIQQSLNTDMVKAENPEAVVATEPQVQQTLLQPPSAEPPAEENAV